MGIALSLVATFGIVACDDSSSADNSNDPNTISCKSSLKDSVLIVETTKGELSFTSTTKIEDGIVSTKIDFNKDVPEAECNRETVAREEHFEIECKGKTITEKSKEKMTAKQYDIFTGLLTDGCKAIDGQKIEKEDVKEALKCETNGAVRDTVVAGVKASATCKNGVWVVDSVKKDESSASDDEEDKTNSKEDDNAGDSGDSGDTGDSNDTDAGTTVPGEE